MRRRGVAMQKLPKETKGRIGAITIMACDSVVIERQQLSVGTADQLVTIK